MAVTVDTLAAALRIDDASDPATSTRLTALITVATAVGKAFIGGDADRWADDVPSEIKDEAVIRIASYLYDFPTTPAAAQYAAVVRNSGAVAVLAWWKSPRLVLPS